MKEHELEICDQSYQNENIKNFGMSDNKPNASLNRGSMYNGGPNAGMFGGSSTMKKSGSAFGSSVVRRNRNITGQEDLDNDEGGFFNDNEFPYMSYILPAQVTQDIAVPVHMNKREKNNHVFLDDFYGNKVKVRTHTSGT